MAPLRRRRAVSPTVARGFEGPEAEPSKPYPLAPAAAGPHGTTTLPSLAFNLTLTKMDSGTSNMSQSTTVEKRDKDVNKCERDPIFQNIAQIAQLSYKSLHCRKFPFQNCLFLRQMQRQ